MIPTTSTGGALGWQLMACLGSGLPLWLQLRDLLVLGSPSLPYVPACTPADSSLRVPSGLMGVCEDRCPLLEPGIGRSRCSMTAMFLFLAHWLRSQMAHVHGDVML